FLAEVCATLGDAARAAPLYEALRQHTPSWVHWANAVSLGPAAHRLALLARTLGRDDEAAAHFENAIAEERRVGAQPFLARSLHEYAVLRRRRGHPGDAARAAELLVEARAIAEAIGMAGLVRKIAALDVPESGQAAPSPPEEGVFRRDGDYWTVAYAARTVRLRDVRGFQYLVQLLRGARSGDPGHLPRPAVGVAMISTGAMTARPS